MGFKGHSFTVWPRADVEWGGPMGRGWPGGFEVVSQVRRFRTLAHLQASLRRGPRRLYRAVGPRGAFKPGAS